MKTTTEIFEEARALISDKAKWTQGQIARDAHGEKTHADSDSAVSWCSFGAMIKVAGDIEVASKASDRFLNLLGFNHRMDAIGPVNDSRTHEEVLRLFDKAIQLCAEA